MASDAADPDGDTITGYEFSDMFAGKPYVPGKMKDNKSGKMVDKPHLVQARRILDLMARRRVYETENQG